MSLKKIDHDCFRNIQRYLENHDLYILWRTGAFRREIFYCHEIVCFREDWGSLKEAIPTLGPIILSNISRLVIHRLTFQEILLEKISRWDCSSLRIDRLRTDIASLTFLIEKIPDLQIKKCKIILEKGDPNGILFHLESLGVEEVYLENHLEEMIDIPNIVKIVNLEMGEKPLIVPRQVTRLRLETSFGSFFNYDDPLAISFPPYLTSLTIHNFNLRCPLPETLEKMKISTGTIYYPLPISLTSLSLHNVTIGEEVLSLGDSPRDFSQTLPGLKKFSAIHLYFDTPALGPVNRVLKFSQTLEELNIQAPSAISSYLIICLDNLPNLKRCILEGVTPANPTYLPDTLESLVLDSGISFGRRCHIIYYGERLREIVLWSKHDSRLKSPRSMLRKVTCEDQRIDFKEFAAAFPSASKLKYTIGENENFNIPESSLTALSLNFGKNNQTTFGKLQIPPSITDLSIEIRSFLQIGDSKEAFQLFLERLPSSIKSLTFKYHKIKYFSKGIKSREWFLQVGLSHRLERLKISSRSGKPLHGLKILSGVSTLHLVMVVPKVLEYSNPDIVIIRTGREIF